MVELFGNSDDPEQMPQNVASDLGLHCLPITLLGVYRLQWVNYLLRPGQLGSLFPAVICGWVMTAH